MNKRKKKSLLVSGDWRPIIRRNNCVCATLGTYSGLVCRISSTLHTLYRAVVMEGAHIAYNMDLHLPASVLPTETPPNES